MKSFMIVLASTLSNYLLFITFGEGYIELATISIPLRIFDLALSVCLTVFLVGQKLFKTFVRSRQSNSFVKINRIGFIQDIDFIQTCILR